MDVCFQWEFLLIDFYFYIIYYQSLYKDIIICKIVYSSSVHFKLVKEISACSSLPKNAMCSNSELKTNFSAYEFKVDCNFLKIKEYFNLLLWTNNFLKLRGYFCLYSGYLSRKAYLKDLIIFWKNLLFFGEFQSCFADWQEFSVTTSLISIILVC